ncbi:MAG: hypothetical protein FWD87_04265 [Spirochaetaceae bacterium]|nr:hypothetical protein [Spirochaetaceae bacterium]
MSVLKTGENKLAGKFEKWDGNPFFAFSKPYLDFIDKGKFSLIYYVMAIINLIIPFAVIYITIESGVFRFAGGKLVFAIILSWLVITFASWIGFQLWWNRRTKVRDIAPTEFIVTLIFAEAFKTFGEWVGTLLGIIGAGIGLIALIFLGNDAAHLFRLLGLDFMNFGPIVIIIGPVTGFFIIILSRFVAEQLRLFASLVNNTKDMATNLKTPTEGKKTK